MLISLNRTLTVLLALMLAASCAAEPARSQELAEAQAAAQPATLFDPDLHIRTADVRPGMTGYGLSVFKGTAIERFEVEVLAVLRRSEQIDTDVVLIKAAGANLEHTGPIAGMSGSPIYLHCEDGKDRLLGAFAFGWPAVLDPIAGVQPIEAMLKLESAPRPRGQGFQPVLEQKQNGQDALATQPPRWDLLSANAVGKLAQRKPKTLAELLEPIAARNPRAASALPGGLRPLSLPIAMTGFTPEAAQDLASALAGSGFGPMHPLDVGQPGVAGGGGPSSADRVEPGASLMVPVLLGDLNLVATGTCTTVIGDRVFGFGHPMIGEGTTSLPFAAGEVDAVIPSLLISFKLGSAGKVLGTLASDATSGVAGTIGPVPRMIPVSIRVRRGQQEQTFRFQAARHPILTLAALIAAAQSAVGFAGEPDPQGATRWDVVLSYSGGHTLRLRDSGANQAPFDPFGLFGGGGGFVGALAMPLMAIQENPFARIELESLQAEVELIPGDDVQLATLEEIALPRQQYKPGETVKLNLTFQLFRGGRVSRAVELKLPEDLPPGQYPLTVTDSAGAIMAASASRPFEFDVKSIDDIFAVLNSLQDYDTAAVYVSLDRPEMRVAIGREAMPDLPGSRAQLLAESGRSDVVPYAPAIRTKLELPYVVTGGEAQALIAVTRP